MWLVGAPVRQRASRCLAERRRGRLARRLGCRSGPVWEAAATRSRRRRGRRAALLLGVRAGPGPPPRPDAGRGPFPLGPCGRRPARSAPGPVHARGGWGSRGREGDQAGPPAGGRGERQGGARCLPPPQVGWKAAVPERGLARPGGGDPGRTGALLGRQLPCGV